RTGTLIALQRTLSRHHTHSQASVEEELLGVQQELDKQRSSSLELQRQRDLLGRQLAHQHTETQRGEVVGLKEALSQVTLQKEVLEEEKSSLFLALHKAEASKAEQEMHLNRLQTQEAALRDSLAKMGALSEGLASDKVELNRLLLQGARLQQQLADLGSEKRALDSCLALLQEARERLEEEVGLLRRENSQLLEQHTQVSRRLQGSLEEMGASRREAESQATALKRAGVEQEELAKTKACLEVQLGSTKRKTWALTQDLAALREEKDSLAAAVFENQELRIKEFSNLLLIVTDGEVGRLQVEAQRQASQAGKARESLEDRLVQSERSHQLTLSSREQMHGEQLQAQLRDSVRAPPGSHERQHATLQHAALQAQREQAEQALLQKETEKAVLAEKLTGLQQDLVSAGLDLQRSRRESQSRLEHDKGELQQLQTHFQESLSSHEIEKLSLTEQIRDLTQQRDHIHQEVQVCRRQLQQAEELRDVGRTELADAHRQAQDALQDRDHQRQEALELRRLLGDEARERETLHASNQELRAAVKKTESDNNGSSLQEEATTLRSTMRQLEKSRMHGRREQQELRRQVKVLEGENRQQKEELQERVLECEAGREAALNESAGFQRRVSDLEEAERQTRESLREKEAGLHDAERRHREVRELSLGLGVAEGRAQGLEDQLGLAEASRRETELKLRGLWSAVRRGLGIGGRTGLSRRRSPSPWRTFSPVKRGDAAPDSPGSSPLAAEDQEVDVEGVQSALRALYQELRDTQRDREEARSEITSLDLRLKELQTGQEKSAAQLLQLQAALQDCEEGKREVSEQLRRAQSSLSRQEEAWRLAQQDKRSLGEELTQLRADLQIAEVESSSLQEQLKASEAEAAADLLRQREAREAAESRASRLELAQHSADGERQRAQLRAAELDTRQGALQERLAEQREELAAGEDRHAAGLRAGEERLAAVLARAEQQEAVLREELRRASGSLSGSRRSAGALQEEAGLLQRALGDSQEDRRVLQEQLDALRDALSESKRMNHALTERAHSLQTALEQQQQRETQTSALKEALKRQTEAGLEAQGSAQQCRREREGLQERLSALQRSVATLQAERGELERTVELQRLRTREDASLGGQEKEHLAETVRGLERDLAENQAALQSLQARSSELELSHSQRLLEASARHSQEMDVETGRLRAAQLQAERGLESRERAHRQRVKGLEGQVLTLKEQLDEELRKRQTRAHKGLGLKPSPKQ
ncbi:hypothetical protein NHX12_033813, partial [Muraenolepis orangiensis]